MKSTLDYLYELLGNAVLLPIPLGTKGPDNRYWNKRTFTESKSPEYQKKLQACVERGGNIGVKLGPDSDRLAAIDVDRDDLAAIMLELNPWLANTWRSKGMHGCQFFVRLKPGTAYPNTQAAYFLKTEAGKKFGEWRCGGGDKGAQSVVFGQHPDSGENYQIIVEKPPIEIDFADIKWPIPVPWNAEEPPPTQPGGVVPVADVQDENRFRRDLCKVKIPIECGASLDSQFAELLGKHLKPYGFFERSRQCVVLEYSYKTGAYQLTPADPYGFCTDIEAVVSPFITKVDKKTGAKSRGFRSISHNLSRTVLASKFFLEPLRPLFGFSTMRVPVRRGDGAIELLPEGYDRESKILTVSTPSANYIEVAELLTLESAGAYLRELLSEFCFQPDDKERAVSVAISAMLTLFCRELLGPWTQKPAFVYSANAEGAGKTLLAKLAIIPHLGYCPTGTVPKEDDEMRKRIFATALADMPVLFLDNAKGYLSSGPLEAFITSAMVTDRVLGASRSLNLDHNSVVFITGNSATYSPDIRRRSLTIELFLEEMKSEDRPIAHPLDDAAIIAKRTDILAALWSLVNAWIDAGEPRPKTTHPSFLRWSETVGGIMEHAGFDSPCTEPLTELSGDEDTRDMARLVDLMNPGHVFEYDELVKYCQGYGLFPRLIPDKGDQEPGQRSKFGKLLKRYNGRILNRKLRFKITGHSRDTRGYMVEDLSQKTVGYAGS